MCTSIAASPPVLHLGLTSFPSPPSVNQVYKELDQMSQSGFGITPLCNSANTLLDISNLLGNSPQVTTVGNLLKNQSQFQEFLERRYNITPELARELLQARLNVNAVSEAAHTPYGMILTTIWNSLAVFG